MGCDFRAVEGEILLQKVIFVGHDHKTLKHEDFADYHGGAVYDFGGGLHTEWTEQTGR